MGCWGGSKVKHSECLRLLLILRVNILSKLSDPFPLGQGSKAFFYGSTSLGILSQRIISASDSLTAENAPSRSLLRERGIYSWLNGQELK